MFITPINNVQLATILKKIIGRLVKEEKDYAKYAKK